MADVQWPPCQMGAHLAGLARRAHSSPNVGELVEGLLKVVLLERAHEFFVHSQAGAQEERLRKTVDAVLDVLDVLGAACAADGREGDAVLVEERLSVAFLVLDVHTDECVAASLVLGHSRWIKGASLRHGAHHDTQK